MSTPLPARVGVPANKCVGFIDGTFRRCARPIEGQQYVYSGYYKAHGIKFQCVVAPNGLIVDFFGPVPGRRSDSYLLKQSGFLERMRQLSRVAGGEYYVYGDPAYPLGRGIMRGYKGAINAREAAFSNAMNALRVSVEWSFLHIARDWSFVTSERNLKIWWQPIGRIYYVAAILTNAKCCLTAETRDGYGNMIAQRFDLSPPTLRDYLNS